MTRGGGARGVKKVKSRGKREERGATECGYVRERERER